MVPALELIRYAPASQPVGGSSSRGRQIFQFAGVEVSSSYGIQCLLEYDAASNECAPAKRPPGSLTVSLADHGQAAGGRRVRGARGRERRRPAGLKDTLLPNRACVTADDWVGTCTFDNLQPGAYLVSQIAAPTGYASTPRPASWRSRRARP